MRWASIFLALLLCGPACVVEDRPVTPDGGGDGGPDGGDGGNECAEGCPDERPVCLDGVRCVECTPDEPDYCTEREQLCNPDTNRCADCLSDDMCTSPFASRCDSESGECAPCQNDAQCNDVDGLPPMNNACDDGECVECTPDTEATTCPGGFSCDPATRTCTNTPVGSLDTCQECVADSECGDEGEPSTDHRCVPMFYPDEETRFPDGETGFCLQVFAPGGCEQPYAIRISDRDSLSSAEPASYCGINEELATCSAVRALETNEQCPGGMDEECPTSGLCRDVGGLSDRCTYRCGLAAQCPNGAPANTCGSSGPGNDDYCGG